MAPPLSIMDTPYSLAHRSSYPVLYVVRHGSTGDDDSYNSPENPHLDSKGLEDAHEAGRFLKNKTTGSILASKHHRSVETAQILGLYLNVKPEFTSALDSLDVGDVADAASEEEADKIVHHHVANPTKVIPGGESLQAFRGRVDPSLIDGIEEGLKTGKPPVFSTHHSIQHEVGRLINGNDESALTKTGGVVAIMKTPEGLVAVPVFKPEKR